MASVGYSVVRNVAILRLNNPPVNGLAHTIRRGIVDRLEKAHKDKDVQAVLLLGNGGTFPAGADIKEFAQGKDGKAFAPPDLVDVCAALGQSELPTVAAIHGTALGGGLETALACHYRVASPRARVGLPEVHLGLLPGAGGTQRLPRLVGVEHAIQMMVGGGMTNAQQALDAGILDALIDEAEADKGGDALLDGALAFVHGTVLDAGAPPLAERVVGNLSVPQKGTLDFNFSAAKAMFSKAGPTKGHAAPPAIVDAVQAAVESADFDTGMAEERRLFDGLFSGPQSSALQHVFFAERASAKVPDLQGAAPADVQRAAVVGFGTMGGGIAMNFMNAGVPVRVMDTDTALLLSGRERVRATYERSSAFRKGVLTPEALDARMNLLSTASSYEELFENNPADVVIEAAFEDLDLKKSIFADLDAHAPKDAVLCTNTSTLDVEAIAASVADPSRVVGTHFFSPANVMRLLENVRTPASSPAAVATVMALGKRLGKVPVLSGNCFGFIGNRMLEGYGQEAAFLVEEGASPAACDAAMNSFGMAMGFFAMSDLAGNDIGHRIREQFGRTGPFRGRYPGVLDVIPAAGFHGQKTGAGWYKYEDGSRVPAPHAEADALINAYRAEHGTLPQPGGAVPDAGEITQRMLFSLANEGFKILEEGIAIRPSDIDTVWCYGYGFPRHKGGPMHWCDQDPEIGLPAMHEALTGYAARFPDSAHLAPAPLLTKLVEEGSTLAEWARKQ